MPGLISEVEIIDLKRSVIDEKNTNRKKGVYKFTKKVYSHSGDYLKTDTRPDWVFEWNRYEPSNGYAEVRKWELTRSASFLTAKDGFVAEGLRPNTDGLFILGDAVLMKIPLKEWLDKREGDVLRANRAPAQMLKAFKARTQKEGAEIDEQRLIQEFSD